MCTSACGALPPSPTHTHNKHICTMYRLQSSAVLCTYVRMYANIASKTLHIATYALRMCMYCSTHMHMEGCLIRNSTSQKFTGRCRGHLIQTFRLNPVYKMPSGPGSSSVRKDKVTYRNMFLYTSVTSASSCEFLASGVSDNYNIVYICTYVCKHSQ